MWRGALTLGLAGFCATACAGSRPRVEPVAADRRGDVETLVSAGCYSCLREALALVEAGHAPDRRFDILALLAIRVREIGLRDEWHWRALARAALPPAPSTRDVLVLKLVDQTRGPRGGRIVGDADIVANEASEILRLAKEYWTVRPHDPVDAYFHLTLACLGLADVPLPAWAGEAVDDLPLVAYRRATCVQADANALAALLAREPRFAEAHYFAAVAALAGGSLLSTEQALDRFEAALPATTASAFLRGQVLMALDEYEPASAQFVQVLAAIPDMPEALLFNLRALSQFDAARGEAAADRLLALPHGIRARPATGVPGIAGRSRVSTRPRPTSPRPSPCSSTRRSPSWRASSPLSGATWRLPRKSWPNPSTEMKRTARYSSPWDRC